MAFRKPAPLGPTVTYSDFTTSFARNAVSNDVIRLTDINAVKRSIKNLVVTNKNERLLNPRIGAGLLSLLFEPMGPIVTLDIKESIADTLREFEPRIEKLNIDVTPDYDNNQYYVTIVFTMAAVPDTGTVEFTLNRIR
jgi:phage baseplate assembly protein W